ncbi:hypothetical protein [Ruminococcus sp.]|uniref:hypothetical protein n=1 Tax=Ruminococcus sp. TaxID=41978 RepID=UPI001B53535F|nr:hypothetical protein [Ruminococcus sp.]MBP5430794.1 hypothetical protein [Ruminococcus sp.]
MKKAIIACLAFISLVSCSNNNKIEQPVKTAATEAATAELTTEAEIPPATEPETVNEVLYEDDNCTITFNRYESLKTVQRLYLTIENKNDNYLRGNLESFSINGVSIEQSYSPIIEAKQTFSNYMTIMNSRLQDENITRANIIEFKMHIEFAAEMSSKALESYDTDTMTITR